MAKVARDVAALSVVTLQLASTPSVAAPQEATPGSYAKGRILVMPRPGLSDEELAKILSVHGGKARKITSSGIHVVELPANASEQAVVNLLAHPEWAKFQSAHSYVLKSAHNTLAQIDREDMSRLA